MVCRGYRPPKHGLGRIGLSYGFPTLVGLRPTSCVFLRLSGSVRLSQPSANQTTRSRAHRLAPTPTNVGSRRVTPQLPRYRASEARLGRADDWPTKAPRLENTPGRYRTPDLTTGLGYNHPAFRLWSQPRLPFRLAPKCVCRMPKMNAAKEHGPLSFLRSRG